ncbi:MAG: arsenical pump-driving ATPase GET3, partial [Actinobacteria bacterium]|nr:arsenical pump-driving ATPase GET3 [Actinomycetota bacterium]
GSQQRLKGVMAQMTGTFGEEVTSTPCAEEMATFDQFVTFLDDPGGDVIVFDTAPTGKTLRELAMPFDWAGFLQKQIQDGKEMARLFSMDEDAFAGLEEDKRRYDRALEVLGDRTSTLFTLVLLPERLPIEETESAVRSLERLGIPVRALVVNQCILPEVIEGNRFLAARARLQGDYREEIEERFGGFMREYLPLLDHDVSSLATLREVGDLLYGTHEAGAGRAGSASRAAPRVPA